MLMMCGPLYIRDNVYACLFVVAVVVVIVFGENSRCHQAV